MSKGVTPPKLQVPELKNSLRNFLNAIKPLISEKSFSEIVKYSESFAVNEGPYLHSKLLALAEGSENWASDLWVHSRFLSNRTSLVFTDLTSAFRIRFNWQSLDDMLLSVSMFIQHVMNSVQDIRNDNLAQEFLDGAPLCMSQYKRFTGSHRLPGETIDTHKFSPDSRHIVVLHRGNIFKMPVYTNDGVVLSLHEMFHLLNQVISLSRESTDHVSVGILTADSRDGWYSSRQELIRSPINSDSLRVIEESLFGISLDESIHCDVVTAGKFGRFGGRPGEFNIYNRWFDLGFQAAFTRDGYMTLTCEHSLMDGSIVLNIYPHLVRLEKPMEFSLKGADESLKVELLNWDISRETEFRIQKVQSKLSDWYMRYDISEYKYNKFGKSFLKSYRLYYHGFINLAVQLTYFKLYNTFVSSFVSVSLRKFRHGRLEHPHILTTEIRKFVEAFFEEGKSDDDKMHLLEKALPRHKEILSQASRGDVYLKHMLALKKLSEQERMLVGLFKDPNFEKLSIHELSVGPIITPLILVQSYPPPGPDQHSIFYKVEENSIEYTVTTIHGSNQCVSSEKFIQEMELLLNSLHQLILTQSVLKSKL